MRYSRAALFTGLLFAAACKDPDLAVNEPPDASTPACIEAGSACGAGQTCCEGSACIDGVCGCHTKAGDTCSDKSPCCNGLSCVNGACFCAAHEGDSCSATSPCCAGLTCDGTNHCRVQCTGPAGACHILGDVCTSDSDCCAPGKCGPKGACIAGTAKCGRQGDTCAQDSDCCGDPAIGSRYACLAQPDGKKICTFANTNEACDWGKPCLPGLTCLGLLDAGLPDAGPDAAAPGPDAAAPGPDAGPDAGEPPDAAAEPPDASAPPDGGGTGGGTGGAIVCGVPKIAGECTLYKTSCGVGQLCNPDSQTNQGYDPCYYRVSGSSLAVRGIAMQCHGGVCTDPIENEPCTGKCIQTAGDPRATTCVDNLAGDKQCLPACASDADCTGAVYFDSKSYNAPAVSTYCANYGTASACQPVLCYAERVKGLEDEKALYKPCANKPDSLCIPMYVGDFSSVVGLCMRYRSTTAPTIGEACNPRSDQTPDTVCGKDAVCQGGVCRALCDASAGTPGCPATQTCVSTQGIDLIAAFQYGGCGVGCDPLSDLAHSGCAANCGGPPAKCHWIIGETKPGQPPGYCGGAIANPAPVGAVCPRSIVDPCESGARCLTASDGVTRKCYRLCDPDAAAKPEDQCPAGKKCNKFFKHSGYCDL